MEKAKEASTCSQNPNYLNKTQSQILPLPRSKPSKQTILKRRFPKESIPSFMRRYGKMNGADFSTLDDAMKYCKFFVIKNFIEWQNMNIFLSSNIYKHTHVQQRIPSTLSFISKKLNKLESFAYSAEGNRKNNSPKIFRLITVLVCRNLVHLKDLYLGFNWMEEVDTQTMIFLGQEITRNLPHLTKLGLSISNNESITDEGIEALALRITRGLPKLMDLSLSFRERAPQTCSKVSDKGLISLVSLISKHLCRLQKLRLNFPGWEKITDYGLNSISSKIILLTHLQDLSLDFSWCNITDPTLKQLETEITKHLQGVKFELNIHERMNPHLKRPNQNL